jgi:hypothetical protein
MRVSRERGNRVAVTDAAGDVDRGGWAVGALQYVVKTVWSRSQV